MVTRDPSAFSIEIWQATRALPSNSTVQLPHWPEGEQPSLGDVTPSSSRRAASRCGWPAEASIGPPFSSKVVMSRSGRPVPRGRLGRPAPRGVPPAVATTNSSPTVAVTAWTSPEGAMMALSPSRSQPSSAPALATPTTHIPF